MLKSFLKVEVFSFSYFLALHLAKAEKMDPSSSPGFLFEFSSDFPMGLLLNRNFYQNFSFSIFFQLPKLLYSASSDLLTDFVLLPSAPYSSKFLRYLDKASC